MANDGNDDKNDERLLKSLLTHNNVPTLPMSMVRPPRDSSITIRDDTHISPSFSATTSNRRGDYRARTAPSLGPIYYRTYPDSGEPSVWHSIVTYVSEAATNGSTGFALLIVVLLLVFGVLIMHFVEKIGWLDSFYFFVLSIITIGYGDRDFKAFPGRFLGAIWLIVSTLAVARVFWNLAKSRVDNRNRKRAIKILSKELSVSQFFAANVNNDGHLSKSDYVIYMLKRMRKITDNDIIPISNQFDKLDQANIGNISIHNLREVGNNDW